MRVYSDDDIDRMLAVLVHEGFDLAFGVRVSDYFPEDRSYGVDSHEFQRFRDAELEAQAANRLALRRVLEAGSS